MDPGIYEVLVTEALRSYLDSLQRRSRKTRPLHTAEAADRIALHLSRQFERSLAAVGDSERVRVGIEVARDLIARLAELVDADTSASPVEPGEVLHAILERRPDGMPQPIAEPLIPLLDTTLLTNAPGEPGLWNQLDAEIDSADAIDVVMAFIRRSGITPLLDIAAPALRTRPTAARTHDDVHRLDRAARARAARRPRRRGPRLLRRQHHAPPRQGVAVPPQLRLLDRLHRLVEPDALRAGQRPRVERPRVGGPQSRRDRQGRRGLRELLERAATSFPTTANSSTRARSRRTADTGPIGHPEPDRAAPRAVPGAAARADRAVTRARSPPQPARRRDRHGQDRHGRRRLRAAS